MIEKLLGCKSRISEIVLYKYNVEAVRKFSFGTWTSRQHVFIAVKSENGNVGYGENIISTNDPDVSLCEWQNWSESLIGFSVENALILLRQKMGVWRDRYTEMCEIALVDLIGKEKNVSALSLLGLNETHPVPGAFVVLSDDVQYVEEKIREAKTAGLTDVVKVKLFGKMEIDRAIIGAVRKYCPRNECCLIGDVNCGYRMENESVSIDEIARNLKLLYNAGLDACEDPAFLSVNEWVELQTAVHPLALIPDYIMRPSSKALSLIRPGMGKIYNIHPGSAGSLLDAVVLAKKILSMDAGLMIGDDSLVGPSCTVWQQLGIALGAKWIEAIEKPGDSDRFTSCLIHRDTISNCNPVALSLSNYGFGLRLDDELLKKVCDSFLVSN